MVRKHFHVIVVEVDDDGRHVGDHYVHEVACEAGLNTLDDLVVSGLDHVGRVIDILNTFENPNELEVM